MSSDGFLWWRDGVIYQIYPRSFADSNQDGLGDLPGITSRLDYLKELGIDAIWLSPIYPSPDADFGYDISDHCNVDPRFGTLADFDTLVQQAHERDIHVVLDLVLNHTSDRHAWFLASRSSEDNPYRDWYVWRDPGPGGSMPNNWQSSFGGPAWSFDPATGQYYLHMFLEEQPDVDWRNSAVREAQLDVVRFWLKRGVDGFRLDVFNAYFKHPTLPDNPPALGLRGFDRQKHVYDMDQPEMYPLLAELRSILDSYPERYAVGETFLSTPAKAAGYCGPDRLHAAFDFDFTNSRWNARRFLRAIRAWESALGPEKWPNYVLSNHDLPRAATRYAGDGNDERLKVCAAMLLTLRGTPFLYYGEEIGMRDVALRRDQILDPPGKRYWPFYKGRDGCRAPMQWEASANAGFSPVKPWLPLNPDFTARNVAAQRQDPRSLFNFYRSLLALRRSAPALHKGGFTPLDLGNPFVMAYTRSAPDQTILVILNFSNRAQTIRPGAEVGASAWKALLCSQRENEPALAGESFPLKPGEVLILEKT